NDRVLWNAEAAYLAGNFLRVTHPPQDRIIDTYARAVALAGTDAHRIQTGGGNVGANSNLLSDDDFRDLFQKLLAEVLAYSPPSQSSYSSERDAALQLVNTLRQMAPELQTYAADKAQALQDKFLSLQNSGDPQRNSWARYQNAINEGSTDAATEVIN